jgi:TonB family protein
MNFESWILSYLLNSLWQMPLLFAAGWLAARALRPAGAVAEHRIWVCVLLAQSLLPAFSSSSWDWLRPLFTWGNAGRAGETNVSVVMGAGTALTGLQLPAALLTVIAIAYGASIAYFTARFVWRWRKLSALRRESVKVTLTGDAAIHWTQCSKRFGIGDVSIAASSQIFGPLTMGLSRKLLLLPAGMAAALPEADLHTVIAHEFAHMRRNDFLKNLIYEVLLLPVSYHPVSWLTHERIMESREMVCDQMAAEISGPNEYALSLLRLASLLVSGMPIRTPHAIGIFDANAFERRLMKLTEHHREIRGIRKLVVVVACAAFGVGTCASTLALSMHVYAAGDDTAPKNVQSVQVAPGVMAGNKISGPVPKYPVEAKKARIQGTVVLNAVIGKDGNVEELKVESGPKELQQSALDAVRQWTYKPYLLNGEPIEVKTTINVTYTLAK